MTESLQHKMLNELKPLLYGRVECAAYLEVAKKYVLSGMNMEQMIEVIDTLSDDIIYTEMKDYLQREFLPFVDAVSHNCAGYWRLFNKSSMHWKDGGDGYAG